MQIAYQLRHNILREPKLMQNWPGACAYEIYSSDQEQKNPKNSFSMSNIY